MVLLLAFLLFFSASTFAADFSSIRQYVYPVIVVEPTKDSAQQLVVGSGSAVVVQGGYALTAAHVVPKSPNNIMYIVVGRTKIRATPIKIDHTKDLALLSVSIGCPCAKLASSAPAIDDAVVSTGYPLYIDYQIQLLSHGLVQGYFEDRVVTTTTTAPGGSGGGVFSKQDNNYQLVGITVAIASAPMGPPVIGVSQEYNWLSFSIAISAIHQFLRNTPVNIK